MQSALPPRDFFGNFHADEAKRARAHSDRSRAVTPRKNNDAPLCTELCCDLVHMSAHLNDYSSGDEEEENFDDEYWAWHAFYLFHAAPVQHAQDPWDLRSMLPRIRKQPARTPHALASVCGTPVRIDGNVHADTGAGASAGRAPARVTRLCKPSESSVTNRTSSAHHESQEASGA